MPTRDELFTVAHRLLAEKTHHHSVTQDGGWARTLSRQIIELSMYMAGAQGTIPPDWEHEFRKAKKDIAHEADPEWSEYVRLKSRFEP